MHGSGILLGISLSVKPQVCNASANCSNPNFILCKIVFVSIVTLNIVNSISRPVVNIIVLCKGLRGLSRKKFNKLKSTLLHNFRCLMIKLRTKFTNTLFSVYFQYSMAGRL